MESIVCDLGGFRPSLLTRAFQKILESRSSFFREQLNAWLATIGVRAQRVVDAGGGANPVKGKVRSWDVEEYVILDNALERQKTQAHIVADLNQVLRPADNPSIACRVGVFDVLS